jgi:hypothetical protein
MPRMRDPSFLWTAAIAGLAGFGAIGTGIGIPLFQWLHGGHPDPMIVVFSIWGFFALMGCAASLYVYFQSGRPPSRPPHGGEKVVQLRLLETRAALPRVEREQKAA